MILKVIIAILGSSVKGGHRVVDPEDLDLGNDLVDQAVDLEDQEEGLEDQVEGQKDQDDQVQEDQEVIEDEAEEAVEVEGKVGPSLLA